MSTDPRQELEAAAAKERNRVPEAPKPTGTTPAELASYGRNLQRQALGDEKRFTDSVISWGTSVVLACAPAVLLLIPWFAAQEPWIKSVGIVLPGFALFFAGVPLSQSFLAWRSRGELRSVQGLDAERYLARLAERRYTSQLEVRVTFAPPLNGEDSKKAADASSTWAPDHKVRWQGDQLVFDSGKLDTHGTVHGATMLAGKKYFDNQKVHRSFRGALAAIRKLRAVHPVSRIDTEVLGEIDTTIDAREL